MTPAVALAAAVLLLSGLVLAGPAGAAGTVFLHHADDAWRGVAAPDASRMAAALAEAGAIRSPIALRAVWRLTGGDTSLHPGPVAWERGDWPWEVAGRLGKYRPDPVRVTIPPGSSPAAAAAAVCGAVFERAAAECAAAALPVAGDLFPDTYLLDRVEVVASAERWPGDGGHKSRLVMALFGPLLEQAAEVHSEVLAKAGGSLSLSLAGLVEAEASLDSERARIAGVIANRLAAGMRLQIDASALYCLELAGEVRPRRVLHEHLRAECPHNTYLHDGLPPGPIALPGRASLEAAARPERHDFLYYVLDWPGPGHLFASTYEEHLGNVEASRAKRDAGSGGSP